MAILKTLTVNGVTYDVVSRSTPSVTLPASAWVTNGKRHSQVVSIDGVTKCSQVDLTPDAEQLEVFHDKDLTFVAENENGVVTVTAIGQKPANDYTIQVTLTEMKDLEGTKIVGNTVGTPLPKSDYTQTDPKKGDYLKGKDVLDATLKQMRDDIDELKNDDTVYVQTVNGQAPDASGNVTVEIPEVSAETPVFDLSAMGLSAVPLTGGMASIQTDTTAIMEALGKGPVAFIVQAITSAGTIPVTLIMNGSFANGVCQCTTVNQMETTGITTVMVMTGMIAVQYSTLIDYVGVPAYLDAYINDALGGDY